MEKATFEESSGDSDKLPLLRSIIRGFEETAKF